MCRPRGCSVGLPLSDASIKALYDRVSAQSAACRMTREQGDDGVYVSGLSSVQLHSLADDGMSVVPN